MGDEGDKYALCIKGYLLHDLNFLLDVREARGGAGEKGERAKIYQKIKKQPTDKKTGKERLSIKISSIRTTSVCYFGEKCWNIKPL